MYQAWAQFPGVDIPKDGAAGQNGLLWFTTQMDPTRRTRSYARTGHWDGLNRANYQLITGSKVTKINFSDDNTATGVEFTPSNGGPATTVHARKEVILAAGTVHTPHVLQLSGVGPADLLERANISVRVDLPGVGANFQDHSYVPSVGFRWGITPTYPTVSFRGSGLMNPNLGAFLGLPVTAPDTYEALASAYEAQDPAEYLPAGIHPTIVEGYRQQQRIFARGMRAKNWNFFNTMIGGPGGAPQNLHPVSRGTIYIDPANPQGSPIVDYRAISNPIDMDVMISHVRFMRRFMTTGSLAQYEAREMTPGPNVQTDEQIANWLRGQINPSVYHPMGTAAKMRREWGGVVSDDLLVYGTKQLSVVDASIIPTSVGCTTTMTVYAIAEKVSASSNK